ncbi:signal peptidase II [Alphaproteobacteria bacterium]|nr:signal peptidase II [Alphaproteobacteria bacterium]
MFGNQLVINKFNLIKVLFILSLILLDQITKSIIENNFSLYESLYVNNLFSLTFIVNYGFAFGFLNNPELNQIIVVIIISIVIFYIGSLMLVNKSKSISLSFAVIIAGAIGNLVDRIIRGYVVDFLDFNIANYHWPAFNLADSYISIGFIVIMINILKGKKI